MRVQNRRCDSRPGKKAGQTAKSLIIHDRSDPHRGADQAQIQALDTHVKTSIGQGEKFGGSSADSVLQGCNDPVTYPLTSLACLHHGLVFTLVRAAWTGFETDRRFDSPSCDVQPASKSPARVVEPEAWYRISEGGARSVERVAVPVPTEAMLMRRCPKMAIFSADGRTARRHVPMRSGAGLVVHQQFWRREAKGWRFLDEREA